MPEFIRRNLGICIWTFLFILLSTLAIALVFSDHHYFDTPGDFVAAFKSYGGMSLCALLLVVNATMFFVKKPGRSPILYTRLGLVASIALFSWLFYHSWESPLATGLVFSPLWFIENLFLIWWKNRTFSSGH
jgi:hypothetical protein